MSALSAALDSLISALDTAKLRAQDAINLETAPAPAEPPVVEETPVSTAPPVEVPAEVPVDDEAAEAAEEAAETPAPETVPADVPPAP